MISKATNYAYYLLIGDLASFVVGISLALVIRSGGWPRLELLTLHIFPFSIIFILWVIVFYIASLYDMRSFLLRGILVKLIVNAQLVNSGVVILLFYFSPSFLITPKTVLVLDLIITLALLITWRLFFWRHIHKGSGEALCIVGDSQVAQELSKEFATHKYGVSLVSDPSKASIIVFDMSATDINKLEQDFLPLLKSNVRFFDLGRTYEEIFGRVALSMVDARWLLENISLAPKTAYTILKRILDVIISLPLFLISIVLYPLIFIFQQIETKGPIFYIANRVGKDDKQIPIIKFRTMTGVDFDKPELKTLHKVTRVGAYLRMTRLDELPQLWNVIRGDLSLVGPRPEFPSLVEHYVAEVPYYNTRHIVKPGLSGWAQVNDYLVPRGEADVELTKRKIAYDLYYIKNRSFLLDLKIALKTIKTLISRAGA